MGRMPEITGGRGRSHRGATCFGRGTGILGVDLPTSDLLSRRGKYTRVYTTVYPRVYNSVHACTQLRSKYVRSRAPVAMSLGVLTYGRCGGYGWVSLGIGSVLLKAVIRRPSWRGTCFAGDGDYSFLCVEARVGCDYVWREGDGEGETSTRPIASVHHYYLLSTMKGHA